MKTGFKRLKPEEMGWGFTTTTYHKILWNLIYVNNSDPDFSTPHATHLFWRFWWFRNFKNFVANLKFDTLKIHDN